MLRWTQGPLCSVNNCTSRQWRILDGQSFCRNGHVRAGLVEFAADDVDRLGRSFHAPRAQQLESVRRDEDPRDQARALRQAYVYLVKVQAEFLVKEKGVPPDLLSVARALAGIWVEHLGAPSTPAVPPLSSSSTTTNIRNSRYSLIQPFTLPSSTPFHNSLLWPAATVLMAARVLRYPLYASDLLRWAAHDAFPLQKGIHLLPATLRNRLAPETRAALWRPGTAQLDDQLFFHVAQMEKVLRTNTDTILRAPPPHQLLSKLLYLLFLPPELYPCALNFLSLFQTSPSDDRFLYALLIFLTKLVYGLDSTVRHPKPREPATAVVDWDLWLALVRRAWADGPAFAGHAPADTLFWKTDKLERCLDWVESLFCGPEGRVASERRARAPINRFVRKTFKAKEKESEVQGEGGAYAVPTVKGRWVSSGVPPGVPSGLDLSQINVRDLSAAEFNELATLVAEDRLESDDEMRLNGDTPKVFENVRSVCDSDLFSAKGRKRVRSGLSFSPSSDSDSDSDSDSSSSSSSSPDSDSDSDSGSDDFSTFYQDRYGTLSHEYHQDASDTLSNRSSPIQPSDHNLLEINQLVQSTTMAYDLQLSKFRGEGSGRSGEGDGVGNGSGLEKGTVQHASDHTPDNDWEDLPPEPFHAALLYPDDYHPKTPGLPAARLHNRFMARRARSFGDSNALRHISAYPEHVHDPARVAAAASARMDVRRVRYCGRRLRPGHRFVMHRHGGSELVRAMLGAAPAVVGCAPRRVEEYLERIEALVLRPNVRR